MACFVNKNSFSSFNDCCHQPMEREALIYSSRVRPVVLPIVDSINSYFIIFSNKYGLGFWHGAGFFLDWNFKKIFGRNKKGYNYKFGFSLFSLYFFFFFFWGTLSSCLFAEGGRWCALLLRELWRGGANAVATNQRQEHCECREGHAQRQGRSLLPRWWVASFS